MKQNLSGKASLSRKPDLCDIVTNFSWPESVITMLLNDQALEWNLTANFNRIFNFKYLYLNLIYCVQNNGYLRLNHGYTWLYKIHCIWGELRNEASIKGHKLTHQKSPSLKTRDQVVRISTLVGTRHTLRTSATLDQMKLKSKWCWCKWFLIFVNDFDDMTPPWSPKSKICHQHIWFPSYKTKWILTEMWSSVNINI